MGLAREHPIAVAAARQEIIGRELVIAGNVKRSRRLVMSSVYGLYAFTALIALSGAMIIYAFVSHDYTIKYVARSYASLAAASKWISTHYAAIQLS